jgi:hypothetical protein
MATNDQAESSNQKQKSRRKEVRLQIAAQIAAANYDKLLGAHASGTLAERLERLMRDADSLIEANRQFQAAFHAQRREKAEAAQATRAS